MQSGKNKQQRNKIIPSESISQLIHDHDVIATDGFVGIGFAEEAAIQIEQNFLNTNHPNGLTLIYAAGQGDGAEKGLNHFGHPGMVKKIIGGHWGLVPKLQKLAMYGEIEAYNLPQGVISHMFRDIAAHKPRTITHVGLGTFVDPRYGGGKIGSKTKEDIVEIIHFDEQEYLAYKLPKIDVAILRGTTADPSGNITMEKEALTLEVLSIAMAAKNSGGIVIVQVERIAKSDSLNPRDVKIPGILVDYIIVAKSENHMQTFLTQYNPAYAGEICVPIQTLQKLPLNVRKVIARRAAMELEASNIVNLGIGMPESIANIAYEEGFLDQITLTTEPGTIGGIPAGGLDFGSALNMQALIDQPYQFDFYDGRGLDIAFLGLAQADQGGNLNVSKFGTKLAGAGGFINISQNAKKVIFVGTFTAGSQQIEVLNGSLKIIQDGLIQKFVESVEHITFSGNTAIKNNQPVFYITERAVFKLSEQGMELIEIAPGINIENDIINKMGFKPIINHPPVPMEQRFFLD